MKILNIANIVIGISIGTIGLSGCDRTPTETEDRQEVVTAEEIAQMEGIAEPGSEAQNHKEITRKLLLEGDEDLFKGIDTDANEVVSVEEFEAGLDRVELFGHMDVDKDKVLGEDEFHAAMFRYWDDNNDSLVDAAEYLSNAKKWFPEDTEELENFADIDVNDDGKLSRGEFIANMDDIELFDQWDLDTDAKISHDELAKVLRDVWDVDDDMVITIVEFGGPAG